MDKKYIGWFNEDGTKNEPEKRCLITGEKYALDNVKTISLIVTKGQKQSFFFRVKKDIWDNMSQKEQSLYESSIIDNIK